MTKALTIFLILADLILPTKLSQNIEKRFYHLAPKTNPRTEATTETRKPETPIRSLPVPSNEQINYSGPAKSIYAVDLNTNLVLLDKNSSQSLPMASLTKLMTAYLSLKQLDPEKIVTVSPVTLKREDSKMGLIAGEKIRVRDLEAGLLIQSAGDAAIILAREISGEEAKFTKLMNATAQDIGLKETRFTNPVGLDDNGHYASAKDLVSLTRILLLNARFKEMVSTKGLMVQSLEGRRHYLENTNKILDNNLIYGVKTGKTDLAGECLVTLAKVQDREILVAVLGSKDRFKETLNIINLINTDYKW